MNRTFGIVNAAKAWWLFSCLSGFGISVAEAAENEMNTVSGVVSVQDRNGVPIDDHSNVVIFIDGIENPLEPDEETNLPKVSHAGKRYSPRVLPIQKNTVVDFYNDDNIYHNVFSVSRPKAFDLGVYPEGVSKLVKFDQAGLVKIYCNIHPNMISNILVLNNEFFALTNTDGSYSIPNLPDGEYTLRLWSELSEEVLIPLRLQGGVEVRQDMEIRQTKKTGTAQKQIRKAISEQILEMALSIKTKVFSGLFFVVTLTITIVYVVLQYLLLDLSRQEIGKNLEDARLYFSQFEELRAELLLTQAASVATTPHLKAILSILDVDSLTVYSAADGMENIGPQDLRLVVGPDGYLLADLNNANAEQIDLRDFPGLADALSGREFAGNWQYEGEYYKVAITPSIGNSQLLGLLVIGELLASPAYMELAEHVGGAEGVMVLEDNLFPADRIRTEIVSEYFSAGSSSENLTDRQASGNLLETVVDSHRYYTTALPLSDLPGTVIFFRSGELVEASIARTLWLMIICSAIAVAIGLLFSLSVSQRITAPIIRLTHAAKNFGRGNYDVRVGGQGKDEFGRA